MGARKVAILGYGRNGSTMHAGGVDSVKDFEMAAVCDVDAAQLDKAKERYGCAVYDDYHAMLAKEQLDLVIIVTRSDQHCQMTVDCLEAGANVLVTKPWAVNEAESLRMIDAWRASGRKLLPWLPSRYGTDFRRLRELVGNGAIGRVFHIRRIQPFYAMRNDWQMWQEYGGGYLLNWGPHLFDTAMGITPAKAKTIAAEMRLVLNQGDTEDVIFALITKTDGTMVTVEHTAAACGLPNWIIQGDEGTITASGPRITIHAGQPKRPADPTKAEDMASGKIEVSEEKVAPDVYGNTAEVYADIGRTLCEDMPFPVGPEDALELSRLLDSVRQAAETQTVVHIG